jgi:hypothetical protein
MSVALITESSGLVGSASWGLAVHDRKYGPTGTGALDAGDRCGGRVRLPRRNRSTGPAPAQRLGLEWLFRLVNESRRLWRRYLLLNPHYSPLLVLQAMLVWTADPRRALPPERELRYG